MLWNLKFKAEKNTVSTSYLIKFNNSTKII